MTAMQKYRLLIAKPGLEGHDRGQDLVMIKSMKMESGVSSPCDGGTRSSRILLAPTWRALRNLFPEDNSYTAVRACAGPYGIRIQLTPTDR